jgi:hypothetical protein
MRTVTSKGNKKRNIDGKKKRERIKRETEKNIERRKAKERE